MRTTLLAAAAALALAASLGACSREEATQVKEGAQAVADKVGDAAVEIKNDPDVKEAGTAIKEAAKDAGTEIKEGAQEAGSDLKQGAAKAGAEIKDSAQDVKVGAKKAGNEIKAETDGNPKTN